MGAGRSLARSTAVMSCVLTVLSACGGGGDSPATSSSTDTTAPSVPTGLTATALSASQIDLAWTTSTDDVGVTGYRLERCQGSSCTDFTQVGTPTSTTYSETGLTANTSYTYRVRAVDTAGNLSGYSTPAAATTQATADTTPPSIPTALTATALSASQIDLAWTASTDDVSVTGYEVERCPGSSCTTFTPVGTPTTNSYSDTGLTASTAYTYRVRATDAAGNLSDYSGNASATTSVAAVTSMDPAGCTPMTDAQLQSMGYEPVRAHGAVGDGVTDDTAEIRAAITAANDARRVVYLHPGTYLVSGTLEFRQDIADTRGNNGITRFGQTLLGSYCGDAKPTIRLADGTATETNEQTIATEPFPVVLLWRDVAGATGPDDTDKGLDWNQVVRNVRIVLGNNPGAVGIRHTGAEGSSAQEVTIDATGGFAGFYNLNGSGGYTYNVEVIGGRYGIYDEEGHGGALLVTGLTLSGQENTPIAINGFTPFGVVGFDITHNDGRVISGISGGETNHTVEGKLLTESHDSSGHIYLVDGQIDVTGGATELLANTDRSVYLRNVYVRGQTNVLANDATSGRLRVSNPSAWTHIDEFSYTGPYDSLYGEEGHLIGGARTEWTYANGTLYAPTADITVSDGSSPPADLLSRHTYRVALCNVEASDNVFVTDHGADPNDSVDDTANIQAAIDAASSGSNRVFLPASSATPSYALTDHYRISETLRLGANTQLCGVTRYSSVLDATGWSPSADSPVIETVDAPDATTVIADFVIWTPSATGYVANGDDPEYDPHVYSIHWRSGRNSINRDVLSRRVWGDPGRIRVNLITGNGGGKWYGITQEGPYPPPDVDPDPVNEDRPFRDGSGNLIFSPQARQMLIEGTQEPLSFYPYHCQHMTQPSAALCEIRNASNVTIYGIKSEMASLPERMSAIVTSNPPDLVPVLMFISGSDNIALIGHEGTGQTDVGRALIEVTNSSNVTIASMGRRSNGVIVSNAAIPQDQWYFVQEDGSSTNAVTAQGFLALYKSD